MPMRPTVLATAVALSSVLASCTFSASAQPASGGRSLQGRHAVEIEAVLGPIAPTGPGCVAGVKVAGEVASISARGLSDLEHLEPLTAATVFETGSLAKQFVGFAMLLLAQDGKLSLDDDIRRYLPELPDYGTPITIRRMLTHTSGLREQWSLLALAGRPPGTQVHNLAMILDLSSRQKGLNFAPGAEFLYTNTNYTLAAVIIERVSGQSLQQFTDQRVFKPLGMLHTSWREDFRTVVPGRATAYAPDDSGFIASMPFTNVYGNGGLLTTVGDLLRWNAFLDAPSALQDGASLVKTLETPGRLSDDTPLEYALGLEVTRSDGHRLVSHSGSTGGYKTWLGRYPSEGISIAVLCNNGGADPIAMGLKLAEQALRATGHEVAVAMPVVALVPAASSTSNTAALAPYEGLFRDPVAGELLQVSVVEGRLTLRQGTLQALTPLGEERFQRADGSVLQFKRSGAGMTELTMSRDGRNRRFVSVKAASKDAAAFGAYIGNYYSAELGTRVTVDQRGRTLVMRQPFAVEWALAPSFADGFTTRLRGTATILFKRDAAGQVVGFSAWAQGARDLTFVRE